MRSYLLAVALTLLACSALGAATTADAARGERLFGQCQICHAIGLQAANQVGPTLNGLDGRLWASIASYNYSPALIAGRDAGRTWNEDALQAWLADPKATVPGTKMLYAGLHQPEQRADLIAYLRQFSADGSRRKQ